jgi:hypothetical protein
MIDITTIQTFKIPPSIRALQESNGALKFANESLSERNDTLIKLLIISVIIIPILGFVLYQKKQITKKQINENSHTL